jgi:23S rRNA (adenine2503-C2)-methyltransferase
MPVNDRYPIAELLEGCKRFPHKKRQRIMFEYTMLEGINDSDDQARQLVSLLRDIPCKFNLLSMNEIGGEYRSPKRDRVLSFQKILRDNDLTAFIRKSRGADISAACGQLAGENVT